MQIFFSSLLKNRYKHTAIITMKIILTSCCLCNEITYIFELIIFMGSLCIWTSFYPPGRLKRLFLVLEPEYWEVFDLHAQLCIQVSFHVANHAFLV